MIRADFAIVHFMEHLGDKEGDLKVPGATWVGDKTGVRNFYIAGIPTGEGYLIGQFFDVHSPRHRIVINGNDLPGVDIATDIGHWQTWMDVINKGILRQGNNTLQVVRDTTTADNFVVGSIVVHWREYDELRIQLTPPTLWGGGVLRQ